RIAFDAPIDIIECRLLSRGRANRDRKSASRGKIGNRDRHGTRAADDDLRPGQHGLDEYVHGALAWTHVLGETHAATFLTGLEALVVQGIRRLYRDQARFPIGDRVLGGLEDRRPRAAAADP